MGVFLSFCCKWSKSNASKTLIELCEVIHYAHCAFDSNVKIGFDAVLDPSTFFFFFFLTKVECSQIKCLRI